MQLSHSSYLKLAAPFILASATTPILGAVGTAVVGRLGNARYIGAVALGAVIFSTIYWLFNFLRLITSSYSSQAAGRGDQLDAALALFRPAVIALTAGVMIIAFSPFIARGALWILAPEKPVEELVLVYFRTLIWGAPFVLLSFVMIGWLMGQMRLKAVMFLQVATNLFNCILCCIFVFILKMSVDGVALATLLAQLASFAAGAALTLRYARFDWRAVSLKLVLQKQGFKDLMSTNFYLMIRTVCMLIMVNIFMARSTSFGAVTLAANSILFQLQYIMGDVFDGLSSASSVYSGLAVGGRDAKLFWDDLRISGLWAAVFAIVMTMVYQAADGFILGLFTDLPDVLAMAQEFSIYITVFPPLAAAGIVYYGIFNGALKTRMICWSMLLTLGAFLAAERLLLPAFGNTGLWLAFLVFYIGRSGFLLMFLPALLRKLGFSRATLG